MRAYLLLFCFLLTGPVQAQTELPLRPDATFKPLADWRDTGLQVQLRSILSQNPSWSRLLTSKKLAVGIVDLADPGQPRFASLNGDHMMYAASLPKIAILLATMDAMQQGELKETPELRKDMRLMISKSDNAASTRLIDKLGYDKIEQVMTSGRYGFYDPEKGGGLWVGKRYGKGGGTHREPLKNLSHAASVNQVCRYYYLLAFGQLVTRERSKQMLDILERPELHHKFVNTLDILAPNAKLFRKSGTWKTYHSDSILVWGRNPNRRYILVALVDDPNGEQIIRDLVQPVERILIRDNK